MGPLTIKLQTEHNANIRIEKSAGNWFCHSHLEAQGSSHVRSGPAVVVGPVQQCRGQRQGGGGVGGHSGVTLR